MRKKPTVTPKEPVPAGFKEGERRLVIGPSVKRGSRAREVSGRGSSAVVEDSPQEMAEKQEKALRAGRRALSMAGAAKAARVSYETFKGWLSTNAAFADAWRLAKEEGQEWAKDIVFKRAAIGTKRPIFQRGVKVGDETVYHNDLFVQWLAHDDPRWRRQSVEFTGKGGGPIKVQAVRERLQSKLAALAAPAGDK